jgi:RNA polymerase sigma-70 factor (ECF subfamily)
MVNNNANDEELVVQYKITYNKWILGELFKRHSLMCFAVCTKYLKDESAAEDAVMTIFEKLFTDLHRHDITNFKSWLHTVCRNHCLMQLRKNTPFIRINDAKEENSESFMNLERFLHQEVNENEKEEKLLALEQAIEQLKDKQKECIELFYLQQKSYEEIATLTGYSPNEVKSYIQNGKRNLKIALGEKGISFLIAIILWIQQSA